MTRSQSLKAALAASVGVSSLTSTRIYPLVAPPSDVTGAYPTTLIYKFTADWDYDLNGVEKINAPLEIRSWAVGYDQAHALADAVQDVLMPAGQPKGFSGLLGGAGGINVIHCLIDKEEESVVAVIPEVFVFEVCSYYDLKYIL